MWFAAAHQNVPANECKSCDGTFADCLRQPECPMDTDESKGSPEATFYSGDWYQQSLLANIVANLVAFRASDSNGVLSDAVM